MAESKDAKELRLKAVAVVGAGSSGCSVSRLLRLLGVSSVYLLDDREIELGPDSGLEGIKVGPIDRDILDAAELVILSPGIPRSRPEFVKNAGKLLGEVEFASRYISAPLLGITGTNGKSTTAALAGHIAATAGQRVFIGGNFGTPLSELAIAELEAGASTVDIAVVELSSFQLESLEYLELACGVWLNVQADHLDRYQSFEAYAETKSQIYSHVKSSGFVIANFDDPIVRGYGEHVSKDRVTRWITTSGDLEPGYEGTEAREGLAVRGGEQYRLEGAGLRGLHNHQNAAAAIEACCCLGISAQSIQTALNTFGPLAHRLTLVRASNDVLWFNDSKATNISAAVTAVMAMNRPTILIAGGRDKGASWVPLVEASAGRVTKVLAIGEASEKVREAFKTTISVEEVGHLEAAVRWAKSNVRSGDAVLLAPACASQDQFSSYAERGEVFAQLVTEDNS